jgi:hypothetical protein
VQDNARRRRDRGFERRWRHERPEECADVMRLARAAAQADRAIAATTDLGVERRLRDAIERARWRGKGST